MRELDFLPIAYKRAHRSLRPRIVRAAGALILAAVLALWIAFFEPAKRTARSHAVPRQAAPHPSAAMPPRDIARSRDDTTATIHSPSGQ